VWSQQLQEEEQHVAGKRSIWHLVWTVSFSSQSRKFSTTVHYTAGWLVAVLVKKATLGGRRPSSSFPTSSFSVSFSSPDFKLQRNYPNTSETLSTGSRGKPMFYLWFPFIHHCRLSYSVCVCVLLPVAKATLVSYWQNWVSASAAFLTHTTYAGDIFVVVFERLLKLSSCLTNYLLCVCCCFVSIALDREPGFSQSFTAKVFLVCQCWLTFPLLLVSCFFLLSWSLANVKRSKL
jgi:hypothetical protein